MGQDWILLTCNDEAKFSISGLKITLTNLPLGALNQLIEKLFGNLDILLPVGGKILVTTLGTCLQLLPSLLLYFTNFKAMKQPHNCKLQNHHTSEKDPKRKRSRPNVVQTFLQGLLKNKQQSQPSRSQPFLIFFTNGY